MIPTAIQFLLDKYKLDYDPENISVGPGWSVLLDNLFKLLLFHGWNRKVVQIKQKFGALRVYVEHDPVEAGLLNSTQEIRNIIRLFEDLSCHFCEECGAPGKLRKKIDHDSFLPCYVSCEHHKRPG